MTALWQVLDTLIELVGLSTVGAIPWTRYYLRLVVLAIEIDFLCLILVLLKRSSLIGESLELQTIHVLWLWNNHACCLASQSLEYWGQHLRFWNHLGSRFFVLSGIHILGICLVILAVVVNK